MTEAFSASKTALASATMLAHPRRSAQLSLAVDASGTHIGAVLQQQVGQSWQPLAFYSAKLSGAETRYSAFDRELLAAYKSVRHFHYMLLGRHFQLWSDHKPLVSAFYKQATPLSSRQQRHLSFLSEFTCDLRHVPGKENTVADALSRPVAALQVDPPPQLDYATLAKLQISCPSLPWPRM